MKIFRILAAVLCGLVVAVSLPAPGFGVLSSRAEVRPAGSLLRDLKELEEFRKLFNREVGVPRLVLLMSPT